jgi:hypothetical protein
MNDHFPSVNHFLMAGSYTTGCIAELAEAALSQGFQVSSVLDLMGDAECPKWEKDKTQRNRRHLELRMQDFLRANLLLESNYHPTQSETIIAAFSSPEPSGGDAWFKNKDSRPYAPDV